MKKTLLVFLLCSGMDFLHAASMFSKPPLDKQTPANASITVPIYTTDSANPQPIGTIQFEPHRCGVLIIPNLRQLPPGPHGMHIHEYPSCQDKGMAAGNHLDPKDTQAHRGPYHEQGKSHLGDLPFLYVNEKGEANLPVFAPNIYINELSGHSVMIHAGGDNYADTPAKLGGGGARIACGEMQKPH